MRVVPDEHGRSIVSLSKVASDGVYPVEYTLLYPGRYRMAVMDAEKNVRTQSHRH